jgi:ABC-2 type transport system permease protein
MPDSPAAAHKLPATGPLLLTQIAYQARLLLANGRTVITCIGLPVIMLIGSTSHGHASPQVVAGRAIFGLTLVAWNFHGIRLVTAREAGILKRWRATPLPRWCYFSGRILATVAVAMLAGAATVAVGVCLYHTQLTAGAALGVLAAFALGAAAWAAAATAATSLIPTTDAAAPIFILIYFPVIIISGVLGSISEPRWLSTVASYLPARPLSDAATSALQHPGGTPLLAGHDLLTLAIWAAAGLAAAIITFRWEPHRPARTTAQQRRQ